MLIESITQLPISESKSLEQCKEEVSLQEAHQDLVDAIGKTASYDRVIQHQFKHDWSSEVSAEAAELGSDSNLSLRFLTFEVKNKV